MWLIIQLICENLLIFPSIRALKPPGWRKEWHLGVRVKKQDGLGKLVAFIAGIPSQIRIRSHQQQMVEINFLCAHKKLRQKRLAPVLIKEITRRVHLLDIFQAVYTAGLLLPKPVVSCRYWHRAINAKKLVDVGFSAKSDNVDMARYQLRFKLPNSTSLALKPMKLEHVDEVMRLLNGYLAKNCDFAPVFSKEEIQHYFIPIDKVIYSFVGFNSEGKVIDFISFYNLSSSVLKGIPPRKVDIVNAAYLFYYATIEEGDKRLPRLRTLVNDALILARDVRDLFLFNRMNNTNILQMNRKDMMYSIVWI